MGINPVSLSVLIPGQVRENIALGHTHLAHDEERVNDAIRLAGIDFQEKLPNGFDSYLTVRLPPSNLFLEILTD